MGFEDNEVAKLKSNLHANDITSLELLTHVKDSSLAKCGFEPAQITRFRRAQYFDPIVSSLKSMGFDEALATKLGRSLVMNDVTSVQLLMQAPDDVLEKSGFTPGNMAKFELGKSRLDHLPSAAPVTLPPVVAPPPSSHDDSHLIFISYVQRDTVAETGVVFVAAKQKFPNHKIFLDNQERFVLSSLVANVKKSKNVLVFLSPNYGSSPYCLVELCTAVQSGAKISTVLVHKPGLGQFNFEQMNALLKSGDVSSLLDESGWSVVKEQGITKEMIINAMKAVVNVRAFDLHMDAPVRVRNAEFDEIWDGIVL